MSDMIGGNNASMGRMNDLVLGNAAIDQKLAALKSNKNIDKAGEAASDFEAVFVAEMLKPMFEGISVEAPFGGGKGEEIFRSFLVQEYGKVIARTGSLGLADSIKTEMIKMQEQADNAK